MKLIILLSIIICNACYGQITFDMPKDDTVKVLVQYSDTTLRRFNEDSIYDNYVKWGYFYKTNKYTWPKIAEGVSYIFQSRPYETTTHILDLNFKPTKNLVFWMVITPKQ